MAPGLRRALALGALLSVSCAQAEPPRPWIDPLGVYRSGSRLKIVWARAAHDARVRWPVGVFDTARARPCRIVPRGETEAWCVPDADETIADDEIAFLDEAHTQIARVVDEARCREADAAPDRRMVALSAIGLAKATARASPRERANRYELEAPRIVQGAFTPEGPGCVVSFPRSTKPLCVRPLRRAELADLATLEAPRVPVPAGPAGSAVDPARPMRFRSPDGAVLPAEHPHDERPDQGAPIAPDRFLDGPKASQSPTAARLVWRARALSSGAGLGSGLRLHDRALGRDCEPRELADGVWRCVVLVPIACTLDAFRTSDGSGEGGSANEVLTPSASFCSGDVRSCCAGGPVWLPGSPRIDAHRFGDGPAPRPAIPERSVLFSASPRRSTNLRQWAPQVEAWVYDRLRDMEPDTFARLDVTVDP